MEVLETAAERFDRLILGGVLSFTEDGLAQWCFACKTHLRQPLPGQITHAEIDRLADRYMEHSAKCFQDRHGRRL